MDSSVVGLDQIINLIVNGAQGGTAKSIISGVLGLLTLILWFFLQSKIKQGQVDSATRQTQEAVEQAVKSALAASGVKENEMTNSEDVLSAVEKANLKKLLESLPDQKLVEAAAASHGSIEVAVIIAGWVNIQPLSPEQRTALYKLYGLGA